MRFRELNINESTVALSANALIKHGPERLNTLISMIKKGEPLYKEDGTPITIKKTEAARIKQLYDAGQFKGAISLLGQDGQQHPLSSFLKTREFGGQSVPPGKDVDDSERVAGLRPSQVFQHGDVAKGETLTAKLAVNLGAFQAKYLGNKILTNQYLDSQGRAGAAVKEIAKQIDAGQLPTIPQLHA